MHFSGHGRAFRADRPANGAAKPLLDGAEGELVLTQPRQPLAPLLRFRTRDHVRLSMRPCAAGARAHACAASAHRRHADRARRQRLSLGFARGHQRVAPAVAGFIVIRPRSAAVRQEPPLPISVELAPGATVEGLADRIRARVRDSFR